MDLSELGFTKEELKDRVIDGIVERLMASRGGDDEGREWVGDSDFARKLEARVQQGIDSAVADLAEKHVLPNVHAYIENLTLQETNKWGEARGTKTTFVEYLVQRAEAYMKEDVNYEGKGKDEANGYSWSKSQSRITHLVHKHLHYSIEAAMKSALQTANSAIVGGIEQTVKTKLEEFSKKLKATVEVK